MLGHINSFTAGLNKDISTGKIKNNSYYDALNIHISTQDSLSSFEVTNEKGNKLLFKLPDIPFGKGYNEVTPLVQNLKIIGLRSFGRDIIIFTTNNTTESGGYSQIWKVTYDSINDTIEDLAVNNYLDVDKHLYYNGQLDFSTLYKIVEVVVDRQGDKLYKAYFTDGKNNLRHFNFNDVKKITGTNIVNIPPFLLELVPDVNFSTPQIDSLLSGGNYLAGKVQYHYQLSNYLGAETKLSPGSILIPLTESEEYQPHNNRYLGSAMGEATGKAVKVSINNIDANYNTIKIYAVHYTDINQDPLIYLVNEANVNNNTTYTFVDRGVPLNTLTTVEFTALGGTLFSCQTIDMVKNRIVAGNIKDKYFDIDYDARAYRYNCYNFGGIFFQVDGVPTGIYPTDEFIDAVPGSYTTFRYRSDGITLGGDGPNVSYEFKLIDLLVDTNTDYNKVTTPIVTSDPILQASQAWSTILGSEYKDNDSYSDYSSPINNSQLATYKRGEIYRFGIVFYDSKGRESFVKWIGDIKIPEVNESDNNYTNYSTLKTSGGRTFIMPIGIKFNVSNVPIDPETNEPYNWSIVRVKRDAIDRTILAQGLITPITDRNAGYFDDGYEGAGWHTAGIDDSNAGGTTSWANNFDSTIPEYSKYAMQFCSPEISFNKTKPLEYQKSHKIKFIGLMDQVPPSTTQLSNRIYKIKNLIHKSPAILDIDGYSQADGSSVVAPVENLPFIYYNFNVITQATSDVRGRRSCRSGIMYNLAGVNNNTSYQTNYYLDGDSKLILADYYRELAAQYGGNTYSARQENIYIKASAVHNGDKSVYVFNGDTYINYFELLKTFWVPSFPYKTTGCEILFFPVESSINTHLRHDNRYNVHDSLNDYKTDRLQEKAGTNHFVWGPNANHDPIDIIQDYDLYLYNSAYSRLHDIKRYIPKPINFEDIKESPTKEKISEKKFIGEEIDSWTKFLPNNECFLDVDYGGITKNLYWNNILLVFQEEAIAVLPIEERVTTPDAFGAPLVLGSGDLLGQFGYITTNVGTRHKASVIATQDGVYFLGHTGKLCKYSREGNPPLSDIKGLHSWFQDNLKYEILNTDATTDALPVGVNAVYDKYNNKLLFTFFDRLSASCTFTSSISATTVIYSVDTLKDLTYFLIDDVVYIPELNIYGTITDINGFDITISVEELVEFPNIMTLQKGYTHTLSYNELYQFFESFHSFYPNNYLTNSSMLFSSGIANDSLYTHYKGDYGYFYDTYYDSYITPIIAPNNPVVMIYHNFEYISDVTGNNTLNFNDTFDTMRVWNTYQDTGNITLVPNNNIKVRNRKWRVQIPRSLPQSINDRTDSRIKDYYIFTKLLFHNKNNLKITLKDIITYYDLAVEERKYEKST